MSVLKLPFLLGLSAGFFLIVAIPSAKAGEPAVPVQTLGTQAWEYMSPQQRQMVDLLAKEIFETQISAAQRARISGSPRGRYESLPDWRKAPFRGSAMRQLGHNTQKRRAGAV